MDVIKLKPEREQLTAWFICYAVPTVIGIAVLLMLLVFTPPSEKAWLVFLISLIAWVVVMGLVLLWVPAFYKSLEYEISSDCTKMKKGVFWRKSVTVPFMKITNVDVVQGPLQRALNFGTINVQTAGAAGAGGLERAKAELSLFGIRDLESVKETIMERVRGYRLSRLEQAKESVLEESGSETLEHMLKELMAIRELLGDQGTEKRTSSAAQETER